MNEIQRAKIINKTLNKIYPNIVVPLNSRNVFTLLISVLLSAQCTDVNVNNVTKYIYPKYYKPELDPSDYIELAGGHGRFADLKKIIVISPNGDTFLHSSGMNFLRNTANKGLYPGSIIYVPRQIGKLDGVNYAASIAQIFSSLAISLASLNSINKN